MFMKILWRILMTGLVFSGCAYIEIRPLTTEERAGERDPDKAAKLRYSLLSVGAILARAANEY